MNQTEFAFPLKTINENEVVKKFIIIKSNVHRLF